MTKKENDFANLPFLKNLNEAIIQYWEIANQFQSKGIITIKSKDARRNRDVANILAVQHKKDVQRDCIEIITNCNKMAGKIRGWMGYYDRRGSGVK